MEATKNTLPEPEELTRIVLLAEKLGSLKVAQQVAAILAQDRDLAAVLSYVQRIIRAGGALDK